MESSHQKIGFSELRCSGVAQREHRLDFRLKHTGMTDLDEFITISRGESNSLYSIAIHVAPRARLQSIAKGVQRRNSL